MTLEELAASLPNRFHDAELKTITIDFTKQQARLRLDIWIGDDAAREIYRKAELILSGLIFWVSEPPDARYPYAGTRSVTIDIGPIEKLSPEKRPDLPPVPESAFCYWVFVSDWNAFIYVAAETASLRWLGERASRE